MPKACRAPRAAAALFAASTVGIVVGAQTPNPVFTLDHLTRTMKVVGLNWSGANGTLKGGDAVAAKAQFTRIREQLAPTISFWRDHNRPDAVAMLRTTLRRLDDLDAALSAEPVDAAGALVLAGQVGAACQACHAVYRDQDSQTKTYRLKPGSLPQPPR